MTTCLNCGDTTESEAEFCSAACHYEMEAELGTALSGRGVAGLIVEEAEAVAREAAGDK